MNKVTTVEATRPISLQNLARKIPRPGELLYPILDVLLNGANYGFFVLLARSMSLTDFTASTTSLSLLAILGVFGSSVQSSVARQCAAGFTAAANRENANKSAGVNWRSFGGLVLLQLLCFLLLQPLFPPAGLHFSLDLVFLGASLLFHLALSFLRGRMQGMGRFVALNVSYYLEVCVKIGSYLLLTLVLAPAGLHQSFLYLSIFLAYAITFMVCAAASVRSRPEARYRVSDEEARLQGAGVNELEPGFESYLHLGANILLMIFLSGDYPIIARRFPDLAPQYAVLQKFGQVLFFVISSISVVFLTRLSRQNSRHQYLRNFRFLLTLWGALMLVSGAGFRFVLPGLVPAVFGSEFTGVQPFLLSTWLLYGLIGLVLIFTTAFQALQSRSHLAVLLIGGIANVMALLFIAEDLSRALIGEVLCFSSLCIALVFTLTKEVYRGDKFEE